MGTELIISRELGSVSASAAELTAITQTITRYIKSDPFLAVFQPLVEEIGKCYELLTNNISPFLALADEESFNQNFNDCYLHYKNCYLTEVSKPRLYCETAYDLHLEMKRLDESKTSYPLLKRSFSRLDELIKNWVDNDVWLAMSIDNILKMLQRLLAEIAEIRRLDPEEALLVHHSAMTMFAPFVVQVSMSYEANLTKVCNRRP